MKYDQLYDILPNGLHDSSVEMVLIDGNNKTIHLELRVWIGDIESEDMHKREETKRYSINMKCSYMMVPDGFNNSLCIDDQIDSGVLDRKDKVRLSSGDAVHYIFFYGLNELIFMTCEDIEICLLD